MSPEALGAVGMAAGAAAFVLGIAQLTCEHPAAPWSIRAGIAVLALLGGWTCFDSWDAWAGLIHRTDNKAIAFSLVLALYWAYRRGRGIRTDYHASRKTP